MRRVAVILFLLAAGRATAPAQEIFVAPSSNTIVASSDVSNGSDASHLLYVSNRSSVPVVVFGVSLSACENVRQWCSGRSTNITVRPGTRVMVGRVEPRIPDRPFSYRWGFSYRADSSDARMIAALREQGMLAERAADPAVPVVPSVPAVPSVPSVPEPAAVALATSTYLPPLVTSTQVDGFAQATSAVAPTRQFWVTNKSAYPIVVYSFNLASCVNVKQDCTRAPLRVRVPAGARKVIGRVDARDRAKRYTYDWTYDWVPDTTDARVAAALRARGVREGELGRAENLAVQGGAPAPATVRPTLLDASDRPVAPERFRFRVAPGSILGSTRMPGAEVKATGACIDPAEVTRYEADTTIVAHPAVAPWMSPGTLPVPTLPPELAATTPPDARIVLRWVVDSTGGTLPGSVTVVESPHGLLSVRMCSAVLGARLAPARDQAGRPVRTWVEAPLRIAH